MTKHEWNPFWWASTLLDPVHGLDLTDKDGRTDHGKIVPFLALVASFTLHAVGNPLPLWHLITLMSASFGYGMFRTFLKSKLPAGTVNDTTVRTITENTTHVITERRDPSEGFEASGKVEQTHDD